MLTNLQMNMELYRKAKHGVLLNVIAFHAGFEKNTGCYASYEKMADEIGRSRETTKKQVAALAKDGWIILHGYKGRCRLILLSAKTLAVLMGNASAGQSENTRHGSKPTYVHGSKPTYVHGSNSTPINNSEKTIEKNSVCVHSNPQETVQSSSQKNEHTHTDSFNSFSGETVKKPAKRKARAKKEALPPLPLPKDLEEVIAYAEKIGASKAQAVAFCKYYDSVGWIVKGEVMYNWQSRLELWVETDRKRAAEKAQAQQTASGTKQKNRILAPHEQKYYVPDSGTDGPCDLVWDVGM